MNAAENEASRAEAKHKKTRVETQTAPADHFLDVVRYIAGIHCPHGQPLLIQRAPLQSTSSLQSCEIKMMQNLRANLTQHFSASSTMP